MNDPGFESCTNNLIMFKKYFLIVSERAHSSDGAFNARH